jgi:hypothetical protein
VYEVIVYMLGISVEDVTSMSLNVLRDLDRREIKR